MKNLKKIAFAMMILSGMVFNLSAQTIKERIDAAKTVKVYISITDIVHTPHTNASSGPEKGTGCVNFTQTTPFPANYTDEIKQIVDMLNKGFNTTAFIAGDISTVPVFESGIQKGNQDWLKLGEPLFVTVYAGGAYNVTNMTLMVGEVRLSNSLNIISSVGVDAIVAGKIKSLSSKNLGVVYSPSKESKTCADYDYFVKNFPLADYFDKFKASFESKTTDFITKEMENYDKAMKKKK
jgi:hypothetical protein